MNSKRISAWKTLCLVALFALAASVPIMADTLPDISPKDWPAPKPKVERFVGTEDHGVYRYDYFGNVKQYTDKDGMGDPNAYTLAIDKLGRLWAGNLNTGVSVFNGETWRNYDVVDGPIGERIFDIQTCPVDDDVWIATSAGITRYKIDADEWEHFTREDGLLEDQASSLAFKKDGTLIVGTQCHGLAIFNRNRNGDYKHAKNITAPDRYGPGNCSPVPLTPSGSGLPTNQINQILVARDETIWIATPTGLVKSDKNLSKMQYVRGRDYADKVRGLWGGAPKEWKECPKDIMEQLLPEDYITCLAEDGNGTIWIGTRLKGFMAIDPKTGRRGTGDRESMGMADNYVSAILPMQDGMPLIGLYIGGVIKPQMELTLKTQNKPKEGRPVYSVAKSGFAPLPSPTKPPTNEELRALFYKLKSLKPERNSSRIVALNDDWRTQGNWIDRYGRHSGILCAQGGGGFNYFCGYFLDELQSIGWIGRNFKAKTDQLRNWVHWRESEDTRVLQCLDLGGRKQSEWDDHKETYPMSLDGPHVYGTFRVPPGQYLVSCYFFNKDGHSSMNRIRDYIVSVKTMKIPETLFEKLGDPNIDAQEYYFRASEGAFGRVRDFWGGVYKRFYIEIKENEFVTVRVDANYSFNTIMSAVFFDCIHDMQSTARSDNPFPVRQSTNWALKMNNPIEQWWWRINAMDQILCQRDQNPRWFYPTSRKDAFSLIRSFVIIKEEKPYSVSEIDPIDKKVIRSDVATLLRSVQLYELADFVDFTNLKYASYRWSARTMAGRNNAIDHKWDWNEFYKFIDQGISRQSW